MQDMIADVPVHWLQVPNTWLVAYSPAFTVSCCLSFTREALGRLMLSCRILLVTCVRLVRGVHLVQRQERYSVVKCICQGPGN
jgi:hypothetical protein